MEALPLQTRTLYAELLDRLRARGGARSVADLPGSFVEKTVKGRRYLYFQHFDPGGRPRQTYLGPGDGRAAELKRRFLEGRGPADAGRAQDERLAVQLRAGGAVGPDGPTARVLTAFAAAGVFDEGCVLVGTNAFMALGLLLGWRWSGFGARTADVDLAVLQLAVAGGPARDLSDILSRLEMGFLPVPALDPRSPSTSFKVRGGPLRVDLLTPLRGRPTGRAVPIPALKAHAVALPFLDFLIAEPVEAALPTGSGVLVKVPQPARFAVHKLVLAGARPRAEHAKSSKDLAQAAALARVLDAEGLRGDLAAAREGFGARRRLDAGLARLAATDPAAAALFKG